MFLLCVLREIRAYEGEQDKTHRVAFLRTLPFELRRHAGRNASK
jgi:hypothetical protein